MSFIKEYAIALPHFRISDKVLSPHGGKGQHAICYTDEDIITLAFQACENIESDIDAILFSTTSPVFKDRYHSSYLADLLGLKEGILAMDLGITNRAGTDAIVLADRLLKSGSNENILIVAANVHYPAIGNEIRSAFGHGAVAMVLSNNDGIAKITKARTFSSAMSEEFIYKGEKTQYDSRFARTKGFKNNLDLVLKSEKINSKSINKIYLNSPYAKIGFGQLKKAGFDLESQLGTNEVGKISGHTGSAHGLMTLINSIEKNKDTSLLLDYHNGTNLIEVESKGSNQSSFSSKAAEITHYQDYLTLRKQGKFTGRGYKSVEMFSSEMISERDKEMLLRLKGNKCESCDTIYYIKALRCNACKSNKLSQVQLSKRGTVYSVTSEYYFPNSFTPTNMVVIDLDGGGRLTVQQTDDMYPSESNLIKIGDKVKLVFRKMMENDKKPNYFWKCIKQ